MNNKQDLIYQWADYCQDLGLTDIQILGLAYFNSAIPTVLSFVNQNEKIINPLSTIVKDIGKISYEESNALYLYREFYFNAKSRDSSILPIEFESLPAVFFDGPNNYLNYVEVNNGMLMNSRLTILLIQELGKILSDYNISIEKAFEIGHFHSNFFLRFSSGGLNYALSIIKCNILPHYIASAVEAIPFPNGLALNKDLWLFSKILNPVLNEAIHDAELKEWIWYYHNALFYENKPGSIIIKDEWRISDPNFEGNMLRAIMDTLPDYYIVNPNTGLQQRNIGSKFEKWEEFYPLLNSKMVQKYNIQSPTYKFINQGELCNYLCFKFIAAIETIFEHRDF
jgi:hypothetical protein